jgi:hypothetical protein
VHVGLAGDADDDELVTDGDGDGVLVVAMEDDRIAGRDVHVEGLHVVVMQDRWWWGSWSMVMTEEFWDKAGVASSKRLANQAPFVVITFSFRA